MRKTLSSCPTKRNLLIRKRRSCSEAKELIYRKNVLRIRDMLINSEIYSEIECLLFYGSIKNNTDIHKKSDYDFHLILKRIDSSTYIALKNIFEQFDNVDLSIHLSSEINKNGSLSFQNGTQGQYFIHILSNAESLIGNNPYKKLVNFLDEREVKKSLLFKSKEYLWRLRRMPMSGLDVALFRKYAIRFLKDVLVFKDIIEISQLDSLSNNKAIEAAINYPIIPMNNDEIFLLEKLKKGIEKDEECYQILALLGKFIF